jgi:hypothetical protein
MKMGAIFTLCRYDASIKFDRANDSLNVAPPGVFSG